MKEKIEDKVESVVKDRINNLGFDIEYIEYVKEGENYILRIVLDSLSGKLVEVDECETVSRAIEEDVDKLFKTEYILEISSPGLERQLKNIKLFKKYIGEQIYVKLYKKQEIGKEITGKLVNVIEDEIIVMNFNGKDYNIDLKDISSAHTVFDFQDAFKEEKPVNLNKLNKFNKK